MKHYFYDPRPQVAVLIMSLCFIGFVTILHALAKIVSLGKGSKK